MPPAPPAPTPVAPAAPPAAPPPGAAPPSAPGGGLFGAIAGWFASATAPRLSRIEPDVAPTGALITLHGTGFDDQNFMNNKVDFNGIPVPTLSGDEWTLWVRVPRNATSGPISVSSYGKSAGSVPFTVAGPTHPLLDSLTPTWGQPGDRVWIIGTHLDPNPAANGVVFDGRAARVLGATPTELEVEVPWLSAGYGTGVEVRVTVGGMRSNPLDFDVR
ncbi:MAG: IPT/TIG domain-containing protein [Planctomycetes bacterium]|nr:IPT/TIG domain-containing protein [Planctomycetota bacterium]